MENKKNITIVTHSSGFHTDDIFGTATLFLLLEKDSNIKVVRSRDMEIIKSADYVLDVGGIHDPENNRFDHHQEGGAGKRQNGVPYASFGLIWKEYGEKLCGSSVIAEKVDKAIVQPIDANDNGVKFLDTRIPDLLPFDIGFMTHIFSPTWKEDIEKIDDMFLILVSYAKVLISRVIKAVSDRVEAEDLVLEAYKQSDDKRLIVLENSRYPWSEVLSALPEPLYVVYKNITDETWSVKSVRTNLFTYDNRKDLPLSWAGKMGEELDKITGVEGCVFCHNARFMAVNKTKEGILKMAEIALNS